MKIQDVFIGQTVGFVSDGDRYIGVVTALENIPKNGKDRWIAEVETNEVVFDINIKYLLGVIK